MHRALFLVALAAFTFLLTCPFSKVEESFNIQAIHDICYWKTNLQQYDHFEYPGVVPRTFIGALSVSLVHCPIVTILGIESGLLSQVIARTVLGAFVFGCFCYFIATVRKHVGYEIASLVCILTASQFHVPFYMTRTLPNTFAFAMVLVMYSAWIECMFTEGSAIDLKDKSSFKLFLAAGIFTGLVFRLEIAVLFGCLAFSLILNLLDRDPPIPIKSFLLTNGPITILIGAVTAIASIFFSVCIDSYFWRRLVWPEGSVAWFNIVLNKSALWGRMPFLWYFSSVLPRMLLSSVGMLPVGMLTDQRCRLAAPPLLLYIFLYSFLPHKELRFIIYTAPLLLLPIAAGIRWTCRNVKVCQFNIGVYMALSMIVAQNLQAQGLLFISAGNYPGGDAMLQLRQSMTADDFNATVFVDNTAAQSGVTRFLEDAFPPSIRFVKTERLSDQEIVEHNFDFLLLDYNRFDRDQRYWKANGYKLMSALGSFSHLNIFSENTSFKMIQQKLAVGVFRRVYNESIQFTIDGSLNKAFS